VRYQIFYITLQVLVHTCAE